MRRHSLLALVVLPAFGCQSEPVNPVIWVVNSLTNTNCVARQIPPGSKWVDYDNGGGWVQLGEDGKVRPIPPAGDKVTSRSDTVAERK